MPGYSGDEIVPDEPEESSLGGLPGAEVAGLDVLARLKAMSDKERDEYMQLMGFPEEMKSLLNEQLMAMKLRQEVGPKMRDAGNFKIAANPLEHLAYALRQNSGMSRDAEARKRMNEITQARQQGLSTLSNTLRKPPGTQSYPGRPQPQPMQMSPLEGSPMGNKPEGWR